MAQMQMDTLRLKDGTSMELTRIPEVDDQTWTDVKSYLESNPEIAKSLQSFARNPDAVRGWMQTQLIMQFYNKSLHKKEGDSSPKPMEDKFKALANDPELAPILEEIKKDGMDAVLKMCNNDELMLKFNQKMGGMPDELKGPLQGLFDRPMTLHEAAKQGDVNVVKDYITKQNAGGVSIDTPDHNGITALGFAIGADSQEVVKLLIACKANPHAVDAKGNTGLHYAAGYGRKEVLEFLLGARSDPSKKNADGKSPLEVATQNNVQATIEVLKRAGAH
jgi:hypothetical protein